MSLRQDRWRIPPPIQFAGPNGALLGQFRDRLAHPRKPGLAQEPNHRGGSQNREDELDQEQPPKPRSRESGYASRSQRLPGESWLFCRFIHKRGQSVLPLSSPLTLPESPA